MEGLLGFLKSPNNLWGMSRDGKWQDEEEKVKGASQLGWRGSLGLA